MGRRHKLGYLALLTVLFVTCFWSGQALAGSLVQGYRVAAGDTWWLLAKRYGTSLSALQGLNGHTGPQLDAGEIVVLPVRLQEKGVMYWVQPGDTLYLLSQRTGLPLEEIQRINDVDFDHLQVGQQIFLPLAKPGTFTYTAKEGESLFLLARRFGTTVAALQAANNLVGGQVWAGQIILVPQGPIQELPAPPVGPAPAPAEKVILYRVQPGETLSEIALRYGSSPAAIYETNNLHSDILMPNQPLYVPVNSKQPVQVEGPRGEQKPGYGEFLDWEWARWIYNVGTVATVVDLDTGRSFRVRYLGGSNHADSEPLTPADTAVIKQVFGGYWSWAKRPILLTVGDRTLAASMAGMPHSVETIYDNDFPGHFDLYFWNSRSHNTNEIDPQHQNNVLRAAGRL
ncbi:MAG: LysM peptidoglycan-binding domain-containing protein [Clostridia bacterium]|nr:MAG: LysM peptidoglycan-binding domain-containing protein [Clostridia bacterium]